MHSLSIFALCICSYLYGVFVSWRIYRELGIKVSLSQLLIVGGLGWMLVLAHLLADIFGFLSGMTATFWSWLKRNW